MEESILKILIGELKYSIKAANTTCHDLLNMKDPDLCQALLSWIKTREETPIEAEGFNTVSLSHRMHYPSALLAIEMLRTEPEKAKRALKGFR